MRSYRKHVGVFDELSFHLSHEFGLSEKHYDVFFDPANPFTETRLLESIGRHTKLVQLSVRAPEFNVASFESRVYVEDVPQLMIRSRVEPGVQAKMELHMTHKSAEVDDALCRFLEHALSVLTTRKITETLRAGIFKIQLKEPEQQAIVSELQRQFVMEWLVAYRNEQLSPFA
jgi:hypothetical protein